MKDDLQIYIPPELEARVVALVLGEASAFEQEELERLMEEQPELVAFRENVEKTRNLTAEAFEECDDSEWKLSENRREKILAKFQEEDRKSPMIIVEKAPSRHSEWFALFCSAACLTIVGVALAIFGFGMPHHQKSESSITSYSAPEMELAEAEFDPVVMVQEKAVKDNRRASTVQLQEPGNSYSEGSFASSKMQKGARSSRQNGAWAAEEKVDPEKYIVASNEGGQSLISPKSLSADSSREVNSSTFRKPKEPQVDREPAAAPPVATRDASFDPPVVVDGKTQPARSRSVVVNGILGSKDSLVADSDELLLKGRESYEEGDYDNAFQKYREAANILPSGAATQNRKQVIVDHLQDAAIALASKNRRMGKLADARQLLLDADLDGITPLEEVEEKLGESGGERSPSLYALSAALEEDDSELPLTYVAGVNFGIDDEAKKLEYLDDSIRTNPTLNVRDGGLKKNLSVYLRGLYDKADNDYREVLRKDPYNVAARRGLERVAAIDSGYYRAAYDQTRAEKLMQIDRASEELEPEAVPPAPSEMKFKTKVAKLSGFETLTNEKTDSTFSLNVSDVSFKLAMADLAQGKKPSVEKIRAEEFVNALCYDDRRPSQLEKVSLEMEQCTHPFLPQRNLMRTSLSTAALGRNASTPLRLTVLLDQSGSMERADRALSVQRAFALLAKQLNANDQISLIGFSRRTRLLAEQMKGDQAAALVKLVSNPLTDGGTNLELAMRTSLQVAQQQFSAEAQNRIILLTDGAANLGDASAESLSKVVSEMRKLDIAFDTCGVGAEGLNDKVLSAMAKEGDGRYYFLNRPEDADDSFAKQIAGALRPAAKNVKVQVLFNPERVSSFKLYGFEKHQLKKEDFRNDKVDAAEMAAEESGVALYHFETLPSGKGDVGTVSVRFFDPATKEMVERTWAIPFESDVTLFPEAEPALRLASVAGLFAENLAESAVGGRVELKRLSQECENLKPTYGTQKRFQELQSMIQQARD